MAGLLVILSFQDPMRSKKKDATKQGKVAGASFFISVAYSATAGTRTIHYKIGYFIPDDANAERPKTCPGERCSRKYKPSAMHRVFRNR